MASDSLDREALEPNAVTPSKDRLFPYNEGQGELRSISARWLNRIRRGGGRGGPKPPARERGDRERNR
jgi:hypothetical protein